MILSIYKEKVDNLDMKYIVKNFINNDEVKLENVPRWREAKTNHIYLSLDIISVYLEVVMHQGSVLSPLLLVLSWMLSPVRREVVYLPSSCMLMT